MFNISISMWEKKRLLNHLDKNWMSATAARCFCCKNLPPVMIYAVVVVQDWLLIPVLHIT